MTLNGVTFNTDLLTILTELRAQLAINGVTLLQVMQDTPDNVMVACPYHKDGQERRPSMGIKKDTGVCHCFACDTVVSLQQMISHCFGDDSEIGAFGWNWLLKNFATVSVEERKDVELDYGRGKSAVSKSGSGRVVVGGGNGSGFVSEEELDSYRYFHPYWAKRKITDESLIELFDLGYDKKTDCITMPVRDINGNCLFVARRATKTKYFNYPRGAEKPLYGLYELWQLQNEAIAHRLPYNYFPFNHDIIICESMIDALTCWQYGRYAVALNGLGTQLQFKQLRELPCRKYILATDADEAGMKARIKIRQNIPNKIITEYLWDLSKAKDLNDMDLSMFQALEETF